MWTKKEVIALMHPHIPWKTQMRVQKWKQQKEKGVEVRYLIRSTSRVEGRAKAPKWGLGWMLSGSIIHTNLHNPNNKLFNAWLKHFWCTDEPQVCVDSQDSPWLDLGEATTFPLVIFFVINHTGYIQMSFCLGTSKLSRYSQNWDSWHFGRPQLLVKALIEVRFKNKVITLVENFPKICGTTPECTYFMEILDF
jgi:hypothetical protein